MAAPAFWATALMLHVGEGVAGAVVARVVRSFGAAAERFRLRGGLPGVRAREEPADRDPRSCERQVIRAPADACLLILEPL